MSDAKAAYSDAAKHYVTDAVPASAKEQQRYRDAKEREAKHNDDWIKLSINLNDFVARYAPGAVGRKKGYKYKFVGKNWIVLADMIAGYARLVDRNTGKFADRNSIITNDNGTTHFKILKGRTCGHDVRAIP